MKSIKESLQMLRNISDLLTELIKLWQMEEWMLFMLMVLSMLKNKPKNNVTLMESLSIVLMFGSKELLLHLYLQLSFIQLYVEY